jgi:hypothetical protein
MHRTRFFFSWVRQGFLSLPPASISLNTSSLHFPLFLMIARVAVLPCKIEEHLLPHN